MNLTRILCIATVALTLGGQAAAQQPLACDVDSDADIDRADIALIAAARNQPAVADDPRDPDRDSLITVNDARICTLRCTLSGCASPPANSAPTADAGADQTVAAGALVTLNGSASSDPDGDALTFAWTLRALPTGSAATLSDATGVMPQFVADAEGEYLIDLIVNDGRSASSIDTVLVTTMPHNTPPVANAGSDRTVAVGEVVILDGSLSSDVDGDPLTYSWSFDARPAGSAATVSNADAVQASFTPDALGAYVVRLTVNDGRGGSAEDTISVSTVLGNRPPIANAGLDQAVAVSETVTLDGALSADPDSDPLTYRWSLLARPVGSTTGLVNPNSAQPTFHVDRAGEYVAQLIVNDGAIDSAPDTVLVTSSNTPPVARAGDDQAAVVGDTLQFDGTASSDANDDALAFLWSLSSRPPGSSADLVGSATPTPLLTVDAAGVFVVQLIVNDGAIDSVPDTLIVSVDPPPNAAPQAQNDVASTDQDTPVAIAVLANDSDPDGDALTLVAVTQPAGGAAVIEGAEIRYLPAAGFSGNDAFDYTVSDGRGGESTASVRVEVRAPATLVTVVATDNIAAELGVNTGTFTISRSGDVSAALLVNIALLGTATNGVDFASVPSAVTIPAGAASVTVTIVPIVDTLVEGTESILLQIAAGNGYQQGIPGIAVVLITDSVVVSIEAVDTQASEVDLDPAAFVVSRQGGELGEPLLVGVTTGGSVDLRVQPDATVSNLVARILVTIPAGEASVQLDVMPLRDNSNEGTETLTITLTTSANYTIGAPSAATVVIADDPPVVSIAASAPSAFEAGRIPGTFTFMRSGGNLAAALQVFCTFGGSAQNSADYVFTGCSATIPANQTTAELSITPQLDNNVEGDEAVTATVTAGAAQVYVVGTPSIATITIADDPPIVSLVASDPAAAEAGSDPGEFTLTRSGGNLAAALVTTFTRGGTATGNVDFTPQLPVLLSIPANQTVVAIGIVPIDDLLVEAAETATLTLRASQSYIIVAPGSATVTIADNDP
jgi:hypothetical protein